MDVKIYSGRLSGKFQAPSNKQTAILNLAVSSLCSGMTMVNARALPSFATSVIHGLKSLGATIRELDGTYMVSEYERVEDRVFLNVKNNASTLRFLLPIACILYDTVEYEGDDGLKKQSFADVLYALKGVGFTAERLPFIVRGKLESGDYRLTGGEGANFVSGLMIALCTLPNDSTITFTGKLQGKAGVDACVKVLSDFSVKVESIENGFFIKGGQTFIYPRTIDTEGDFLASSTILALKNLGEDVQVLGLEEKSFQQDKRITSLLEKVKTDSVVEVKSRIDLLPVLCAFAGLLNKKTTLVLEPIKDNVSLRINECFDILVKFGVNVKKLPDGLEIEGGKPLKGGFMIDCYKSTPLVYAITLLALYSSEPVTILGAGAVNKQNPSFFNDLIKLGGRVETI